MTTTTTSEACGACGEIFASLDEVFSHDCSASRPFTRPVLSERALPEFGQGSGHGHSHRPSSRPDAPVIPPTVKPASEASLNFLRSLVAKHEGNPLAEPGRLLLELPAPSQKMVSKEIDTLKPLRVERPAKPAAPKAAEVEEGFYVTTPAAGTETIWKVQIAVHGSGRPYAKVLDPETGTFEYVNCGIRTIATGLAEGMVEKLTLDRAKELGHLYGRCMVCGRTLTDEISIAQGIGPVCAGKGYWD